MAPTRTSQMFGTATRIGTAAVATAMILAQSVAQAGIRITPARVQETITPDNNRFSVNVSSTDAMPKRMQVSAVRLAQDLDGSPRFDESPAGLSYGAELLSFDIDDFILMPNAAQSVGIKVSPPEGLPSAYAAVMFTASSVMGEAAEVASVTRLASLMIFDFGTPGPAEGELLGVRVVQVEPGAAVRVLSTFRNDGTTLASPSGVATVTAPDGSEIGRFAIEQGNTLPGYSRQLVAEWKPSDLVPGIYAVASQVVLGSRTLSESAEFTVVAPNELAQHRAYVATMRPTASMSDLPIPLSFELANAGNVEIAPEVSVSVRDSAGVEVAALTSSADAMAPGASVVVEAPLAIGLPVGAYRVFVEVAAAGGVGESSDWPLNIVEGERIVAVEVAEFAIPTVKASVGVMPRVALTNAGNVPV